MWKKKSLKERKRKSSKSMTETGNRARKVSGTQGRYDSDFDSNISSPPLSEDEDMKSDVVVSSTLKTRNGRQTKAVVRLNLLDLLKETNI